MPRLSALLALALVVPLAACGGRAPKASADAAEALESPDWDRAERIPVSMTEYNFTPSRIVLRAGEPYRLVLRNNGGRDHTFAARGFFRTVEAGPIVDREGNSRQPREVKELPVEKGKSLSFFFVPREPGEFELYCPENKNEARGMTGRIVVVE